MRAYNQGSLIRVCVSESEVYDFRSTWPCSNLPDTAISFTFARRNGDLVDIHPSNIDGDDLLALSQDAQEYARKKGLLP